MRGFFKMYLIIKLESKEFKIYLQQQHLNKNKMNILILGSGGREHAFALKLKESSKVTQLFVAPGNAGTHKIAKNMNVNLSDFEAVKQIVLENDIKMVVVGPEVPLVEGVHDFFLADIELKNIPVIGPKKDGALLEGSKDFSKQFMQKHGVPTARYKSFTKENLTEGFTFLETLEPPYVLKADGLAAGKGVLILNSLEEAKIELQDMVSNEKFGKASTTVVIEEFLKGIELSVFVLTDGKSYKILPSAKDYKRIGEGDAGLNTGGMGAISPVPFADEAFLNKVEELVVKPTIAGLQKEGIDYRGFIFIGLMNDNGNPSVVEYNVRMGDPETEAVLPRITSDLFELFEGVAHQNLHEKSFSVTDKIAATVMLVSGGYPEAYEKNKEITGFENIDESIVFHAGTTTVDAKVVTSGGRVMAITSLGNTIEEALEKSYRSIDKIHFKQMNYRKDIGFDLI
jgi:phosphoribosylamine--glycine ligase